MLNNKYYKPSLINSKNCLFALLSKTKPYCLMPWIHLHSGDDGWVKACCVAQIPYGNLNNQSFNEIWDGTEINKLRSRFAKGVIDNRCAQCINLEAAGGKSIRQETHEKFSHLDVLNQEINNPVYFDIRFSNACNLKCRTCWHGASSSWFLDAKKLGSNKGETALIKNIHDFDRFIEEVGPSLLHAKEIYLAGGEPLVMEEHYKLLNWLIKNNVTNILLRYNTNFTQLSYKNQSAIELWKKFDSVHLLASIDASKELGSYIRSGFNWDKFLLNYTKIQELPNVRFQISPTISVLNVNQLPTLIKDCMQQHMITENDIYINILERPIHFNIQSLPNAKKMDLENLYTEYIKELDHPKLISQVQEIISYMWLKDTSNKWAKFQQESKKLDSLRNETNPDSL